MNEESSAVPLTELQVITDYLEVYRRTARWKLEGLNLEQATRSLVPSASTLLGLVKHLGYVERWWFKASSQVETSRFRGARATRTRHSESSQGTRSNRSAPSTKANAT